MSTQVILLERVENLGEMGETVSVKPGFARNYLLPQRKALRASKQNVAYFEAQKKQLQAESDKKRKEAEALAKKLEGLKVPLIRQASESGQLFGSVTSRDIAKAAREESKQDDVKRTMVKINQNFKTLGLFPVDLVLHPEVKVEITVNIARTQEEAEIQAKTGKAMVSDEAEAQVEAPAADVDEAALEEVLEESALEAEKEKLEAEQAEEQAAEETAEAAEPASEASEDDSEDKKDA